MVKDPEPAEDEVDSEQVERVSGYVRRANRRHEFVDQLLVVPLDLVLVGEDNRARKFEASLLPEFLVDLGQEVADLVGFDARSEEAGRTELATRAERVNLSGDHLPL